MYTLVCGLEIHLQVKTNSKMFCRCATDYFGKEPNINTCPVCFGLPGALPVPNKAAFEKAIKLALALNCEINKETKFDRKNYFYPDLAKGYQISQYDQPIGENGYIEIEVEGDSRRIRIQRLHLEEDTGKSIHTERGESLIDYNKSGIPLIEIVTQPDFQDEIEVLAFAKRLRQIVRYLDISDAEMQKGHMRFELNISLSTEEKITPTNLPNYKVEVKNIGSISVLEKVLKNEIERQSELLDKNEVIQSQTRGLKDMSGETVFQRKKESADDYRYFPEPDIAPIHISDELISELKSKIPELPHERKLRYLDLGLESEQSDIFIEDTEKGNWIDNLIKFIKDQSVSDEKYYIKEGSKWLLGDISYQIESTGKSIDMIGFDDVVDLISLLKEKKISGTIAKDVILKIFEGKGKAKQIIENESLIQISDENEVEKFAEEVIKANDKVVQDLQKNPNAIKFLVGQVMKLSKGKVNPHVAEEALRKKLNL